MKKFKFELLLLTLSLLLFAWEKSSAVSHPFEFHADAGMIHENLGPVAKAYGYMNIVTDPSGEAIINVMFSNGSPLQWARFNARIKFLDADGRIISEEFFEHRIGAANSEGPIERKLTRALIVPDFDSIRVDFYLSDIPETGNLAINGSNNTRVSSVMDHPGSPTTVRNNLLQAY